MDVCFSKIRLISWASEGFFAGGSKEWIFPGVAKKSCPEGPKVVKFHFALSKIRKQTFLLKWKERFQNRGVQEFPLPPSDAHPMTSYNTSKCSLSASGHFFWQGMYRIVKWFENNTLFFNLRSFLGQLYFTHYRKIAFTGFSRIPFINSSATSHSLQKSLAETGSFFRKHLQTSPAID